MPPSSHEHLASVDYIVPHLGRPRQAAKQGNGLSASVRRAAMARSVATPSHWPARRLTRACTRGSSSNDTKDAAVATKPGARASSAAAEPGSLSCGDGDYSPETPMSMTMRGRKVSFMEPTKPRPAPTSMWEDMVSAASFAVSFDGGAICVRHARRAERSKPPKSCPSAALLSENVDVHCGNLQSREKRSRTRYGHAAACQNSRREARPRPTPPAAPRGSGAGAAATAGRALSGCFSPSSSRSSRRGPGSRRRRRPCP